MKTLLLVLFYKTLKHHSSILTSVIAKLGLYANATTRYPLP